MNIGTVALNTLWSFKSKKRISEIIDKSKPDVAHFHNTFMLISPSVYYACKERNVPVIQSLHNPRLLCPAGNFYRDGRVCEDCVGKTPPWPGVLHGCYRSSRSLTALVATMLTMHRMLRTWERGVDAFIVFTEFYKKKFIEGGLPADKIALKPHFVDPDPGCRNGQKGEYALYIGRLDRVKGVNTLLEAWRHNNNVPLKIRGDGNLLGEVADYINRNNLKSVEIVRRLKRAELNELIKNARFLVWPSEGYYETFGLVAIESFAGALAENVSDGYTGLHFIPGDSEDLSAKVIWAWSHPEEMALMGRAARREYETNYSSEKNYRILIGIYEKAISEKNGRN